MRGTLGYATSALLCLTLSACGGSNTDAATSGSATPVTVDGSNTQTGTPGSDPGTGAGTGGGGNPVAPSAEIRVLSNRADLISGDDALVEIVLPAGVPLSQLAVDLNGVNVTSRFVRRADGRVLGLLDGLSRGANLITATLPRGARSQMSLINHANGGPVFSGPQVQPWACRNEAASDPQCNQPAEYSYLYKSTDPLKVGLQPYDPANPPDDVASTTTDRGQTLPFIVRVETGYQARDQYKILTLFRPDQTWTAFAPQAQWNRKLLIPHGGSCGVTFESGSAPLDDYSGTIPAAPGIEQSYIVALGRGFAVASTALDNTGHSCNLVTAAESLMMVKERLIEQYGELRYTIGTGCSGGSITQQMVANAYPGIYQGILPTCSYTDVFSTAVQFAEYHLLRLYFENPSRWAPGVLWLEPQWAEVEGHISHVNAVAADEAFFKSATNPANPECPGLPPALLYNAQTNPGGVRCGVPDFLINVLGPRPSDVWSANEQALGRGFAGLPVDNVGVQYGLATLRKGLITPEMFLDLNEKIGGLDIDIQPQAQRTVADRPALANVYRSGGVNQTTHMDKVAIIDGRGPDPGIAHDAFRVFALRARLDRAHGGHDNHVIWEGPAPLIGDIKYTVNGLLAMDRWLAAVERDSSTKPLAQKIIDNKPADIGDACYDGIGQKLTDGLCPEAVVPIYGTPRMVAGEAITTDTSKCQLKPLSRSDDYGLIPFSTAQWDRLQALFPNGVCDFSKPGVDQQPTLAWQTYQDALGRVIYGGTPMPAAPAGSGGGWAAPAFAVFAPLP